LPDGRVAYEGSFVYGKSEEQIRQEEEKERKEAAEQAARERKEKTMKFTGLLFQFGIMLCFLLIFFINNGFFRHEEELFTLFECSSLVVSFVFGIISRIFRRRAKPKIPWGVFFILLMYAVFTVAGGVFVAHWNIVGSIISVLIPAAGMVYIIHKGIDDQWGAWKHIGILVSYIAIVGILGGIVNCSTNNNEISGNFSMLAFCLSAVLAYPGMIIICKVEKWLD